VTATHLPAPGDLLPYQEMTDDGYAELAAQTFTVEQAEPGMYVLRGPCPRCKAIVDIPVVLSIFEGMRSLAHPLRAASKTASGDEFVEPVLCTCEDEHPKRPQGRVGCGAYWTVIIEAASP